MRKKLKCLKMAFITFHNFPLYLTCLQLSLRQHLLMSFSMGIINYLPLSELLHLLDLKHAHLLCLHKHPQPPGLLANAHPSLPLDGSTMECIRSGQSSHSIVFVFYSYAFPTRLWAAWRLRLSYFSFYCQHQPSDCSLVDIKIVIELTMNECKQNAKDTHISYGNIKVYPT